MTLVTHKSRKHTSIEINHFLYIFYHFKGQLKVKLADFYFCALVTNGLRKLTKKSNPAAVPKLPAHHRGVPVVPAIVADGTELDLLDVGRPDVALPGRVAAPQLHPSSVPF